MSDFYYEDIEYHLNPCCEDEADFVNIDLYNALKTKKVELEKRAEALEERVAELEQVLKIRVYSGF
jgi:uncharacterized protein YceH (UPF0502 family)